MFCSLLVFCLIVAGSSSHSDQCIIVGIIWNAQMMYECLMASITDEAKSSLAYH